MSRNIPTVRKQAIMTTKVEVTQGKGADKETLVDTEEAKTVSVDVPKAARYGAIRYVSSAKLSKHFQSVGVEIGFTEYPVPITEHPEDMTSEFARLCEVVENMLTNKVADLVESLDQLKAQMKTEKQ